MSSREKLERIAREAGRSVWKNVSLIGEARYHEADLMRDAVLPYLRQAYNAGVGDAEHAACECRLDWREREDRGDAGDESEDCARRILTLIIEDGGESREAPDAD